ncbi:MAG: polyphosphate polymerase domain-containing protein [Bacteroidales bacterium]
MTDKHLHTASKLLEKYESVSLQEMDCVGLMDRTDVKFVLSFEQLNPVIESLGNFYKVLTINGKKVFSYRTDYYDTPDLHMYTDHHNGKLNRFKVREREYVESNQKFLEVKLKIGKGRIRKSRINGSYSDQESFSGFVGEHTPYDPGNLSLTLVNRYNRFTLIDHNMTERVTMDFNLSFDGNNKQAKLNELAVIEVKQHVTNRHSMVFQVLRKLSVKPVAISKYCLGISLINQDVKINNFKKTIIMIKRISHVEYSA